ncbi:hypothetical protein BU23DRAFT_334289 [Bimuria novae-zelandiae CBS 107.79]|uniref:Uncharacterized protein n=1 Tax=Bimuria novae-zelandiae CBS 107.79 TaxID=1447943 RepID=A0A6A5UT14_9PLEO|nr:hypothetical protein BU23DRAFT_334289 [Bimuria novae-zelandiae CBS 107.79]
MPEVVIPAGLTIAALIISALGWYGMFRSGVQFVHDDLQARRSYGEDIVVMLAEVASYEDKLRHWKEKWHISEHTDNTCLELVWGKIGASNIMIQWNAIDTLLNRVRKKLRSFMSDKKPKARRKKHFMELSRAEWNKWPNEKKRKKLKYIWAEKAYLKAQMEKFPRILMNIDAAADEGWLNQQKHYFGGLNRSNPYHVQKIYHLKRIAENLGEDFNQLRGCLQDLGDMAIELDLDIFDTLSARSTDVESAQVAALAATNHLKLGLLFKKKPLNDGFTAGAVNRHLTRALVEKATDPPDNHGSPENAFEAVLASHEALTCFFGTKTKFSLSKRSQKSNPPTLRETLKERFARISPSFYDSQHNELDPPGLGLGAFPTFRLCHELGQACVLFLRTELFAGICGCQLQFGSIRYDRDDDSRIWYEYSMSLVFDPASHQPPFWRDPRFPKEEVISGKITDSWCHGEVMGWDNFMQPIRRLGLLFLEIILTTSIVEVSVDRKRISSVDIITLSRRQPNPHDSTFLRKTKLSVDKVLVLVEKAIQSGTTGLADAEIKSAKNAIEICLTCIHPPAPTDKQWKQVLDDLYLDVVQPLRNIYIKLLEEQPFRRTYANDS